MVGLNADAHLDPALNRIVERYMAGEISAPVTLMELLIETEDADRARATIDALDATRSDAASERVGSLKELFTANEAGCQRIAGMLRADVDSPKPARSVEEGISFCEKL